MITLPLQWVSVKQSEVRRTARISMMNHSWRRNICNYNGTGQIKKKLEWQQEYLRGRGIQREFNLNTGSGLVEDWVMNAIL